MKCFVQKVIVAGTEAGWPNNHCHQNRGGEKLAACKDARKVLIPEGIQAGFLLEMEFLILPRVRVEEPAGTKCRCGFIPCHVNH